MARRSAAFTEANIRKLIRATRAEGWTEVRLSTPAGEVILSSGPSVPATVAPDIDGELAELRARRAARRAPR